MPHGWRGAARRALAVATTATAAVVLGLAAAAPANADANTSRDYLVVYDNNIENWLPASCEPGQVWDRLIAYIKRQPKSPDIFAVQQVSNTAQLNVLLRRLTDELPGTYAGKIAIGDPGSMGYTSTCGKLKNQQTNAVIWRSDRLTFQQQTTWRSDAPENYDAGTGPCQNLEPTRSSQDRVHNIAVRLRDTIRGEDVSVASIHWPTGTWHGPDCAAENMDEANQAMDRLGGTLKIVAGDTNARPSSTNWWRDARDHGFRDPIAEQCGRAECSSAYNTTTNSRIDLILAKSGSGFSNVRTITESMTGGAYSDHRAVTAYVKY